MRAPNRPISSWTAATAAKLALERAALVAAAQRLERDVGAEPVVHRARDRAGRRRGARGSAAITTGSPTRTSSARLVAVGGADVDVEALQLDHLFALLGVEQVDRLAADDAGDEAVRAAHLDPLADQDLRVPAADRGEPEEALLVDVGDDEADLVDVADDGEQRARLADPGDRGAEAVAGERGEGGVLAPDRRRRAPRSRRARRRAAACRGVQGSRPSRTGSMSSRTGVRNQTDSNSFSICDDMAITAVITGASSGIGEATAKRLAREPGRRAGPRRPPRGAPAGAGRVAALPGDLRSPLDLTDADAPERVARPRRRAPAAG